MGRFLRRRLLAIVPLLLLVTSMVFSLILLLPGDPAVALIGMEDASEEKLAAIRERMGLDRPLVVQYASWLGRVARGNLGVSLRTGQPVTEAIRERAPITLGLALAATAFGVAVPNFWLGSMLVLVLALHLRWLPATGYVSPFDSASDALRHMLLPTLTLGASAVAEVTRQLRSSLGETLAADFVKTARAKGLAEGRVVAKHALRPALIPVVTVAGLTISRLVSNTVVVESIFALPGLGRLNLESVLNRDFPMLQGAVLVTVLAVIVVNLLSDLLYGLIDPRIRYG